MLPNRINADGHLVFAGADTVTLAKKYGTPLYLMDEERIRHNCRVYTEAMAQAFPKGGRPLYASKALSCRRVYEIIREEGLGADAVSGGELYLALRAGVPAEDLFFHGNSKPEPEIRYAIEQHIGYFVADNPAELETVNRVAGELGTVQKVLLRLTPGIDPHTFAAVTTGTIDSKFGVPIPNGLAMDFLARAMQLPNLQVEGVHCHIGSQIFEGVHFISAAEIMLTFLADAKKQLGFTARLLDLGGGFGVPYVEDDPVPDIRAGILALGAALSDLCARLGLAVPTVLMEPGRSIVADAGITLYTVSGAKSVPGIKNFVGIDGGMTDNPRFALYGSRYTALLANRAGEPAAGRYTIAGRCCESGDLIQEGVPLPAPQAGDTLCVLVTGAYNHSMSSNYNAVCRPPIVMVRNGEDYVAVRRETFADLAARDAE